ncbi:MAG TPA: response regulator, partial [Polyangiaceae bacterium]|nr:response regulator [Polyangiaceae bacterium]
MTDARVILLVEDDSAHADLALRALERCDGLTVLVVDCVEQAREVLARQHVDLVLADLRLPDGSGLDLLQQEIPVVVQTSQGDESRAVAAMKGGALDYCVKSPEMFRDLPIIVERALNAGRNLFERRRAERSLRESDERFRQLAANIPEVFWLFDLASRQVEYASPAWESVYGPVPQTWEGRLQYAHADDAAPLWALGPSDGDLFRVVEGTSLRWVEERRFWINDAQAKTSRLACLAVDVTRRRELEASLSHTQKMHAIGQLAGGVAHDFNNMLAAILSAAEELSESKADPELCELIISASMRASELTRNLLSFSRRGKMELRVLDMHDVVRLAVTLLSRSINPNVRLITSLDATRAEVLGDPSQLESAILNLGLNARDALPPRGGDICFSSRELVFDEASSERKALNLE